MSAIEHGGGLVLFQCEVRNASPGNYKAVFANDEGIFKAKFASGIFCGICEK